jgi:hypothetical protein
MKALVAIITALFVVAITFGIVAYTRLESLMTGNKSAPAYATVDEYMRGMQLDVSGYEKDGKSYLIFTTNKGNMCVVPVE